jgi:tetratricopeptide (TPR) repeat protein
MPEWIHPIDQHLRAAEGWLDLGLPEEARAELEQLPDSLHNQPVALMLWWRVHSAAGQWRNAVEAADELVQRDPDNPFGWIHRSYALHELKETQQAWDLLSPALEKFADEELVPYNLACYACQLGQFSDAKELLGLAMKRGEAKEVRERALNDPDLKPIRAFIAALKK